MSEKKIPRCFKCHEIVTFDNEHIGKSGKKIPLDPETSQPHQCKKDYSEFTPKQDEITEQEASHADPLVVEVQEKAKATYPKHRVIIIGANSLQDIEDKTNLALEQNDNHGHIHKGVTFTTSTDATQFPFYAVIHYEILQPREERMK